MIRRSTLLFFVLLFALSFTGCGGASPPTESQLPEDDTVEESPSDPEVIGEEAPSPTEEPEPTATEDPPTPTEESLPPLPRDPQPIEFETVDGVNLVGNYFPAAVNPAPVVILMHWAGGTQEDWYAEGFPWPPMAPILQNRHEEANAGMHLARELAGFASSYGVVTFNFRSFAPSGDGDWNDMYMDAQSAVQYAKTLEGVDPTRIMTAGASIGADGSVDACLNGDERDPGCIGAISLSPGSYIGLDYTETVLTLGDLPIVCVATTGDTPANNTCTATQEATNENEHNFETLIFEGHNEHGMAMFDIQNDPYLIDYMLEKFLAFVAATE